MNCRCDWSRFKQGTLRRLLYSGIWRRVVHMCTDVSEELIASIFKVEIGQTRGRRAAYGQLEYLVVTIPARLILDAEIAGNTFLRNVDSYTEYTALRFRRWNRSALQLWEPQIPQGTLVTEYMCFELRQALRLFRWLCLLRPPLPSSGQSSWLQTLRSRVLFRRYQIFWEVVGLELGPLSLVGVTEELL
jgi:hypothetical protein